MHTLKINPYREWLKIRSYVDDVPNNYQLLGVADFESDTDFIKEAYRSRLDYLDKLDISGPNRAMKPRIVAQLETALDTLIQPDKKEEYDSWLRLTGRAGLPNMGWTGRLAITFAFVASCFILTATVYIYPIVVKAEPTGKGDSIKTVAVTQNSALENGLVETDLLASGSLNDNKANDLASNSIDTSNAGITQQSSNVSNNNTADPTLTASDNSLVPGGSSSESKNDLQNNDLAAATNQPLDDLNSLSTIPTVDLASDVDSIPVAEIAEIPATVAPEKNGASQVVAPDSANQTAGKPEGVPVANSIAAVPAIPVDTNIPESPAQAAAPKNEASLADPFTADKSPAESIKDSQVAASKPSVSPAVSSVPSSLESTNSSTSFAAPEVNSGPMRPLQSNPAIGGRYMAPEKEILNKLNAEVVQQYKLASLDNSEAQLTAARDMLAESALGNQPVEKRFALLEQSTQYACSGRDAELALQCIVAQSRMFAIDLPESVKETMQQCAKSITTQSEAKKLMRASLEAVNYCIAIDDYSSALNITEAAYKAMEQPAGREFRSTALQRLNEIRKLEAQWSEVQKAKQELAASNSDDSQAADVVARWYCEIEQDWNRALPYLLRSTNQPLKEIAQKENITVLSDSLACMELGNLWWNYSQNQTGVSRRAYLDHAIELYKKALPGLEAGSLDRTRVQKRIDDSEK